MSIEFTASSAYVSPELNTLILYKVSINSTYKNRAT
jgi:hypothetical protein